MRKNPNPRIITVMPNVPAPGRRTALFPETILAIFTLIHVPKRAAGGLADSRATSAHQSPRSSRLPDGGRRVTPRPLLNQESSADSESAVLELEEVAREVHACLGC